MHCETPVTQQPDYRKPTITDELRHRGQHPEGSPLSETPYFKAMCSKSQRAFCPEDDATNSAIFKRRDQVRSKCTKQLLFKKQSTIDRAPCMLYPGGLMGKEGPYPQWGCGHGRGDIINLYNTSTEDGNRELYSKEKVCRLSARLPSCNFLFVSALVCQLAVSLFLWAQWNLLSDL